jgi:hypothetical protein
LNAMGDAIETLRPLTHAAALPVQRGISSRGASALSAGIQPPRSTSEATALVRTVRRTVNEFRDDRRAGLVRARNQLLLTMTITGATAYALLWVAIAAGAQKPAITATLAFYLVGAMVGLFNRLYTEASTDAGVDDYGLSMTRVFVAPLLSGVAAVLGVVFVAVAASATQQAATGEMLVETFNVNSKPLNLLTAALFGLTPGLLLDRLQQRTEGFKRDLKSSEAPGPRTKTG